MKFIEPLKLLKSNKLVFKYWLLFTIIAGQSGIILNIIIGSYKDDRSILDSLCISYFNGDFYTYSIALIASMIGLVYIDFISENEQHFKKLKLTTVITGSLLLFFASITYPFMSSTEFEFTQLIVYILSIALAIYFYALLKLEDNYEEYIHLSDIPYDKEDDNQVKEITENTEELITDKKGNKL